MNFFFNSIKPSKQIFGAACIIFTLLMLFLLFQNCEKLISPAEWDLSNKLEIDALSVTEENSNQNNVEDQVDENTETTNTVGTKNPEVITSIPILIPENTIANHELPDNLLSLVVNYKAQDLYTCLRNFYVSAPNGSDSNNGRSESSAFQTINKALSLKDLKGGDCVNVLPGTYNESVNIMKSGSGQEIDQYLVLRSSQRGKAKIRGIPGDNYTDGIKSEGNYIVIDGFDISAPSSLGHGIYVKYGHHHKIYHNIIHNSGGAGISGHRGDYYEIVSNVVFGNTTDCFWHTSGISLYQLQSSDEKQVYYRNIIFGNIVYDNIESNVTVSPILEGSGIIIADTKNSQTQYGGNNQIYNQRTLIANNVIYNNGAKGVKVYLSDNVRVVNNTTYKNNQDIQIEGLWRGELTVSSSDNIKFLNNLAIADTEIHSDNTAVLVHCYESSTCKNIVFENNLGYNGTEGEPSFLIDVNGATHYITPQLLIHNNYFGKNPRIDDVKAFSFNNEALLVSIKKDDQIIGASSKNKLINFVNLYF